MSAEAKPAEAAPAAAAAAAPAAQKGKKEAPLEEPAFWAPRNAAFDRAMERYKKELEGLFTPH